MDTLAGFEVSVGTLRLDVSIIMAEGKDVASAIGIVAKAVSCVFEGIPAGVAAAFIGSRYEACRRPNDKV